MNSEISKLNPFLKEEKKKVDKDQQIIEIEMQIRPECNFKLPQESMKTLNKKLKEVFFVGIKFKKSWKCFVDFT